MTTSQTFTALAPGALFTDVISHVGTVNVTVDPTLTHTVITVSTSDIEGPLADAVRATTMKERPYKHLKCLTVSVPKTEGSTMTTGTAVSGFRNGTITVDVRLPSDMSSLRLETTSADLTARGDLQLLEVNSLSGDIEARGVHTLRVNTASGYVRVDRVDARVDINSVSGDIEIGAYNGTEGRANTVSGDIHVSATPAAYGVLHANTVSGDITTRGTSHLTERVSTLVGTHRSR
ncbi:DUF4097 family beta strand repeat-containing protein [Streptomyces sp. NPDC001493]